MIITASLAVIALLALAVIAVELARRASGGTRLDVELRSSATRTPVVRRRRPPLADRQAA